MSDWKPGDVAMRDSQFGGPGQLTIAVPSCGNGQHDSGIHWHHASGGYDRIDGSPAYRRMVVIDPMDASQVARLADLIRDGRDYSAGRGLSWGRATTEALREFANPTPPKPEEPIGLGAVVEDFEGVKHVRAGITHDGAMEDCWRQVSGSNIGYWSRWGHINAVRVLSEGVPQ